MQSSLLHTSNLTPQVAAESRTAGSTHCFACKTLPGKDIIIIIIIGESSRFATSLLFLLDISRSHYVHNNVVVFVTFLILRRLPWMESSESKSHASFDLALLLYLFQSFKAWQRLMDVCFVVLSRSLLLQGVSQIHDPRGHPSWIFLACHYCNQERMMTWSAMVADFFAADLSNSPISLVFICNCNNTRPAQ